VRTDETLDLEGVDLGDLSLDGLEITSIGDARNLPEMGASSVSSSCKSSSCCGSSSCSVEVERSPEGTSISVG
jgi:thiazolylpeptide-type bacteriocin precursor